MPQRSRRSRQGAIPDPAYTLAALIEHQPAWFRRHSAYPQLVSFYNANPRLRTLRIRRLCWQVMNRGRVSEENLHAFVRTYKLPDDPFFTVFFRIKREYHEWQQEKEEERLTRIASIMRGVPPNVNRFMIFLAHLEELRDSACPLWKSYFFPRTLKRANELVAQDLSEWIELFSAYLEGLHRRFRGLPFDDTSRLLACMILDCLPDLNLRRWPLPETIKEAFRSLSKQHHPDAGGNPQYFRVLAKAREVLLNTSA